MEPAGPARDAGTTTSVTVRPGGRSVTVVLPTDPDRWLTDPDVLRRNERDGFMPYWAYLWPGAFLLAEAVAREPWAPGTEALEIGCGLGLAGLAGVAAGLRVTFTDYTPEPLRFVERSLAANAFPPASGRTALLDWTDPPADWYPLILGADLLYERDHIAPIARLLDRMLPPGGLALFAGTYRSAAEDLPAQLRPFGLSVAAEPIAARDDQGREVYGTLHRIRRLSLASG